jgi:glycosyltransferase involved in cell wall biosynthesis
MSARLLLAGQLRALDDVRWWVVSGDPYPDPPPGLVVEHVAMRREPALSDIGAMVRLYRFFADHRFAFVQTHTPKASLLGLPAARLARQRALYTMHGSLYFRDNGTIANVFGWVFERWCCGWAHRVLIQSEEDAAVVPQAHLAPSSKITWIGNGIDLERFRRAPLPSHRQPVVLMVSRLVVEKGCRDFFAVARALAGRAKFVHVGPTEADQRDAIPEDEIRSLERAGVVTFRGPVDDVRPHLADADIVLHPSYREGVPRVVLEAAAVGRPVVGYDIRGMRDVIPPDPDLLVPRGDVAGLTQLVSQLLGNEDRRVAAAEACHGSVDRFSEHAVVARLREVYAEEGRAALPRHRRRRYVASSGPH